MSAATRHGESRHKGKREHFDLPIPATPTLAAEVASDRIPELVGEHRAAAGRAVGGPTLPAGAVR